MTACLQPAGRLKAACLAADLLADAAHPAAEPAPAQHQEAFIDTLLADSSVDAQQSKQPAAGGINAGNMVHLPARIRERYLELLLEWVIIIAAKSVRAPDSAKRGDKKGADQIDPIRHAAACNSTASNVAPVHHDARLWRLLRRLLAAGSPSGGLALSETFLSTLSASAATLPTREAGPDLSCMWYRSPVRAIHSRRQLCTLNVVWIASVLRDVCRRPDPQPSRVSHGCSWAHAAG